MPPRFSRPRWAGALLGRDLGSLLNVFPNRQEIETGRYRYESIPVDLSSGSGAADTLPRQQVVSSLPIEA
jgi:hypothetical protein